MAVPSSALAEESLAWRCKQGLDVTLAACLLILLSPLLLVVSLLVLVTSGRPLIYRRRVVGLDGLEFDAFKLRTMVRNADEILRRHPELRDQFGSNMKLRDDPRLTPLGGFLRRSSLDELPQLVNVLRGEMSLVGPRMIAPEEAARYGSDLAKRLSVPPGVTGLWQVSGRQEVSYEERIRHDLHYIDNWSLWLDLSILLRTIPAVLSMKGAF